MSVVRRSSVAVDWVGSVSVPSHLFSANDWPRGTWHVRGFMSGDSTGGQRRQHQQGHQGQGFCLTPTATRSTSPLQTRPGPRRVYKQAAFMGGESSETRAVEMSISVGWGNRSRCTFPLPSGSRTSQVWTQADAGSSQQVDERTLLPRVEEEPDEAAWTILRLNSDNKVTVIKQEIASSESSRGVSLRLVRDMRGAF